MRLGELDKAIADYDAAIEINPYFGLARDNRLLAQITKRREERSRLFRQAFDVGGWIKRMAGLPVDPEPSAAAPGR